nr:Chain C, Protein cubitus interruptus [synthetic construct]3HQM_D Chain D, Protein cubitus interruptus [synthetic construct]3IVQ_C Chain C, CiSBC2 [synthetic construct]3IVQ_D Chain D, CiSBC2 [synthetic construct]
NTLFPDVSSSTH